jgi:peptide-methionine (S)-S-oxide reductase
VISGYTGGASANPTYDAHEGHYEAVQITFDPGTISFAELLEVFWRTHDPTTLNRQGADVGPQYRSIILTHSEHQSATALEAIRGVNAQGLWSAPLVTEVAPCTVFHTAEGGHQGYFRRNATARAIFAPTMLYARKMSLTPASASISAAPRRSRAPPRRRRSSSAAICSARSPGRQRNSTSPRPSPFGQGCHARQEQQ